MNFISTSLEGAYLIHPTRREDSRGWFARTFCKESFHAINHVGEWKQINHSYTKYLGTVRGLHFQHPPHAEIKLVRCIAGKILDVIVDLRKGSSTFLHSFATELTSA